MSSTPNMTLTFSTTTSMPYGVLTIHDSFHIIQLVTITLSSAYVHSGEYAVMLGNTYAIDLSQSLEDICRESVTSTAYNVKTFYCETSISRQRQDIVIWGFNYDDESIRQVR